MTSRSKLIALCTGLACSGLVIGTSTASAQRAAGHGERAAGGAARGSDPRPALLGPRRSSLVQRGPVAGPPMRYRAPMADPPVFGIDFRTIDGTGNNLANPDWGAAAVPFLRSASQAYGDGVGSPAGADRASARAVSNAVAAVLADKPNEKNATDYLWQWGQFIDHDFTETPVSDESFDIEVPAGDVFFDPFDTGAQTISMDRSFGMMVGGVREQQNNITAYLDGSMVYGSEDHRAEALRAMDGTGRLKVSAGDLLPFNVDMLDNAMSNSPVFFLAGDLRSNEQTALTAMHTLFVREHNRLADELNADFPALSGDEVYERARAIVTAQIQAITYNEWLPLLLGPGSIPAYSGYKPGVNAGATNEFATAAFRVGHTMLSPQLMRFGPDMQPYSGGHLDLADAFFDPQQTVDAGIEPTLRGLSRQRAQEIDGEIVDAVRNFLFGPPGAGGFDLASLNIQRGRDHGLASYNEIRVAFGRPAAQSFADVCSDPDVQAALSSVYSSPDDIDAWVGLLAEDHKPGAMVGETLWLVLRDQFTRMRDGDRFWYERYLPADVEREVERTTLGMIINRNMNDGGVALPRDVFRMPAPCAADLAVPFGILDLNDVDVFIAGFASGDASVDFAEPFGVFDLADVNAFVAVYLAGCP